MTDQELLNAMQSDDTDQIMIAALRQKLEDELEKPDAELNIDKINQITATLDLIAGTEQITAKKTRKGIETIKSKLRPSKKRRAIQRFQKIAVCACLLLVAANILTYSVYGTNSFSAAYQFFTSGVVIDFSKENDGTNEKSLYLQDMQKKCQEHDLDVLLPNYFPDGLILIEQSGTYYENAHSKDILFFFQKENARLNLHITQFLKEEYVTPLGLPSDSHNISSQTIGETTVHIQTEGQQYWAAFQIDLTQYVLYADKLDYDECQRVLKSMFQKDV